MKLRIRSLESKETLRIEVPDPCSLQNLRQILSRRLASAVPSLHLSLNRRDELHSSSSSAQEDSLRSLGITSGDLIFYTLDPHAFSPPTQSPPQTLGSETPADCTQIPNFSRDQETNDSEAQVSSNRDVSELNFTQSSDFDMGKRDAQEDETLELGDSQEHVKILNFAGSGNMDVDFGCRDYKHSTGGRGFSFPELLRKLLAEEGDSSDQKVLLIAVHVVLLESGLVAFDPVSGMKSHRFHCPDEWPSIAVSLYYALPDAAGSEFVSETVQLKFQNLGRFVNVYGSLNSFIVYRACLDRRRFAPSLRGVCKTTLINRSSDASSSREVFEFWKIVKDGLALPLMIDICERTGLPLPPCLMCLPVELKVKILEFVPGNAVAMVACTCSEFRYLSENDDLWKQKFLEEFGQDNYKEGSWKYSFASLWKARKQIKKDAAAAWKRSVNVVFPQHSHFFRFQPPCYLGGGV